MLLFAFTLPGTPVLTAGEEYGRTGFIGEQMDWEKAENNTMYDYIRKLVKIRENNLFSKYDKIEVATDENFLQVHRYSKSNKANYLTKINLYPNESRPLTLTCNDNFIVTPNCCRNR